MKRVAHGSREPVVGGRRTTRQLETVERILQGSSDHPTAEQLFERVRAVLPKVGRGTVYRNLSKLVVEDRVKVVPVAGRSMRYDGRTDRHDHFVCAACGLLVDVEGPARVAQSLPSRVGGHRVESLSVSFVGLCRPCEEGEKRKSRA